MKPNRPTSANVRPATARLPRPGEAATTALLSPNRVDPSAARGRTASLNGIGGTTTTTPRERYFQLSVGHAIDCDRATPSGTPQRVLSSPATPTPTMYGFVPEDLKQFDVGTIPDLHEVFSRPSSARTRPGGNVVGGGGSPRRAPLHPRPPSASTATPTPATARCGSIPPGPILFDGESPYSFGTATAQLRAQQQCAGSMGSTPVTPHTTTTTTPPAAAAAAAASTPPIVRSAQHHPTDDEAQADQSAIPSTPEHQQPNVSPRPATAKRPQTATAAYEVRETFDAFAENVHTSAARQLARPLERAAPNDKEDMQRMQTFEHVVAYYAEHSRTYTPVKFVHMKRPARLPGAPFRPYDLVVTPPEECSNGEEHYVVSSSSVVHMLGNHQPAQVQTVSQFAQEASLFNIVTKIKFFRTYLKKKMLDQWVKNIRRKMFLGVRAKLSKKLFLAKRTYATPLRQLHHELASMQRPPLVKLPHVREGLSLERFSSTMVTQKMMVLEWYRATMERVEASLGQLVASVQTRADVPDFGSQEALEQYVVFMEDQTAKKQGGVYQPHLIPITKRKENMRLRLAELRGAIEEQQQIANFVRLVDYIAAESMFYKALSSIKTLTEEIARSDDEKTLFFLISVTFGDDGVLFVPTEEELLRVTSDASEDIIASTMHLPRLLTSKVVRGVIDAAESTKLQSMATLLREDSRIVRLRECSKERIEADFLEGREATRHFGKNKKWLAFVNKTWPALLGSWNERLSTEAMVREFLESRNGAVTHEEFADVFRKADEAFQSLKEMHAVRRGCLVITSTVVLDFLMAKLRDITAECREKVLTVAKSRLDRVAATLNARIKALQERPTQLPKFALFVSFVHGQLEDVSSLFDACDQIEQLYTIAELNGCEPGQEAGRRELVLGRTQDHGQSIRSRFEEATHIAKDYIAAHSAEMGKKLMVELEVEFDSITTFSTLADSQILKIYNADVSDCLTFLTQLEENIAASEAKLKTLLQWVALFELPTAIDQQNASLVDVKAQLKSKRELWTTIERFNDCRNQCYSVPLAETDTLQYSKDVDELYTKTYNRLHPRHQCDASERLLELLREEKLVMPTLMHLGNKNLKREHWAKILANQTRTLDPSMTLESLRHMKLFDAFYREVINEQSAVASGEATLLHSLEEIKSKWGATQFQTKPFRDLKDQYILDDVSDITQQVEEHQLLIQSCLASRFVAGVRPQIEDWERRLHLLSLVLEEWVLVQSSWMYLAFIFSGEDMKRQLPTETSMFKHVNTSVRELIHRAQNFKNCIVVATDAPVLETLKESRVALDTIHKRLEEYLETKRAIFPRFYFLSNDELLSILSDVRNPRAVRPHLRKCFDSVNDLVFKGDSQLEITGVVSMEGEVLSFSSTVVARGGVENWLGALEQAVVASLKANMMTTMQGLNQENMTRRQWYLQVQQGESNLTPQQQKQQGVSSTVGYLAQCIQAIDAVQWTSEVEEAIARASDDAQALPKYLSTYRGVLQDTVKTVRMSLTPLQRSLIQTILVLSVHNRDVVQALAEQCVSDLDDFSWRKQLRTYFASDQHVVYLEHVRAKLDYCYEYLGSAKRLVITPLTDRAFLTCTQALHLNLGAAPQGPAGTGKTESVKDLGKALARHVVVFNCSDGINTAMMGQMFAGLAQAGSWACFDEFNRIELEVLSVVAQQMLEITSAVARRLTRMTFDGHELALNLHFGVFVTMNPGYAGRTELPDNLQALFRPVCMMIPDYRLIAEIMFFSEGFLNAQSMSTKMVQLYKLSSEQLSKQDHYDFGMRAVKSILVTAGAMKRAEPNEDEDILLIRAMRSANLPKFLEEDARLFNAIIGDLYPNMTTVPKEQQRLQHAIEAVTVEKALVTHPRFTEKTVQLFDTMVSRFGVMLVGPTLAGKTTSSIVLETALTTLAASEPDTAEEARHGFFLPTWRHTINPKALSRQEMYGSVNTTTREWADGVLSHIVRSVCTTVAQPDTAPARYWITFDGPVDALWIENLNTVLDDNKMLCLVNGERIKLPDCVTFLFEVEDLKAASPATVSRCGMVYYDAGVAGWQLQLRAMTQALAKKYGEALWDHTLFDTFEKTLLIPSLEFLDEHSHEWIGSNHAHRIQNMMHLLDALLAQRDEADDDPPPTVLPPPETSDDGQELPVDGVIVEHDVPTNRNLAMAQHVEDDKQSSRLFEMMVLFSFIWGIGGNQCDDGKRNTRKLFSQFAQERIAELDPAFPTAHANSSSSSSSDFSIFDACIHKGSLRWVDWAYKVPSFLYRRRVPFGEHSVATPQSVSTTYLVAALLRQRKHVLINGTTGTGKSVNVQQSILAERLQSDDGGSAWQSFTCVLSAQSTGQHIQDMLEARLRKHPSKRKDQLCIGPAAGKTMIVFVDDLNMPECDAYGACPTLELLRQLMGQGGIYDKKRCIFKAVADVVVVACCGPPGGNRAQMSPRLASKHFLLCQPQLGEVSVHRIFGSILQGFLSIFSPDVRGLATALTRATLDIFLRVSSDLLPTPERAHYVFNMRDIGRVVQGLTQTVPSECLTKNDMLRLWVHEAHRVFCDRLISSADRSRFQSIVGDVYARRFSQIVPANWYESLYGDFTSLAEVPLYRLIEPNNRQLQEVLTQKLREYAVQHNKDLDLVMFDDAVKHLTRLCRILRQARGNALLIGINGCGRQSLAQLAAFLCRCKRYQIQLTSAYDHIDFRNDLKNVLKVAGCDNEPVAFIVTDSQIVKEAFLEDINGLLNTGEITNLWDPDDVDHIIASTRDRVRRAKKPETVALMLSTFVASCRDNLHVVLTMSPMGNDLFRRLRTFPSLINCMTIDWYDRWPLAALHSVASKMLSSALSMSVTMDGVTNGTSDQASLYEEDLGRIEDLCQLFVYVHTTVEEACETFYRETRRKAYCTPTSYIGLLQSFAAMLKDQREASEEGIQRFQTGLERLQDANRRVDDMQTALTRLQPELEAQTIETQRFAEQVDKEQQAASEVALVVAKEEAQCSLMMREAQLIKDECQAELDKAMPAYNEALDALNALNPKDIQEAKAYTSPPKKVEMVMDAVLTILDEATGWDNAKRVLGRPEFVTFLKTYDMSRVTEKALRRLHKYTELDDFKPELIRNVSKACVSFCLWCRAVENYCEVLKLLEPKKQKLAMAEAALQKAKAALALKQAQLAELEARLAKLRQEYDASMARLKELEAEKARTELHLARAAKLLAGLSSEHERWTASIKELQGKSQHAMSLTALASAFVAYAGIFDVAFRDQLVRKWSKKCHDVGIPMDLAKQFSVQDVIDPVMIRHWNSQGLPLAEFSIQNATIVSKSARWCLCIDPNHQANAWIKNTYKHQGLMVLRMNDANLTRQLEVAVRGGLAVLIEDVETTLDSSLDPVLRRETFRSGGRLMLTVRDQPVEYNPSFFLIMTSRLANPHFLPEIHVKTTILNFDVTSKGLEDQLLSEVVRCEKRELEDRADQLLMQVAEARNQLKGIEDQILSLLSNSSGNLLENDVLITTLHQSKHTGAELAQGLHVIEGTSVDIQAAREVYRPIATRGAILFSVIQQVSRLDHMYQTSLHAFVQQFRRTMLMTPRVDEAAEQQQQQQSSNEGATSTAEQNAAAPSSTSQVESSPRRNATLIDNITLNSYQFISRSLFEADRGVFRFLLAASIAKSDGATITEQEWRYFLTEAGGELPQDLSDLPGEWMPEAAWENLQFLSQTTPAFEGLAESIAENEHGLWAKLRLNPFEQDPDLLPPYFQRLSLWHRMLVLRTLNSSVLDALAKAFVEQQLGPSYNAVAPFDLGAAHGQSTPSTPIAFLLSQGTDPTITFAQYAERVGMAAKTTTISLGQGQGSRAEAVVQKAMATGQWVFLQNCHVYVSWLPQLARLVESIATQCTNEGVHSDFRLWLSTLPTTAFPVSVLQASIKLTREPPRGVRANLRDSLALTIEHDAWKTVPSHASGPAQLLNWRKLLFALSVTHAILQERRKFGPVGWNVPYSWSLVDLENTLRMCSTLCENEAFGTNTLTGNVEFCSWNAVYHVVGDIYYGGRVTDMWDARTLRCILERVVNAQTFRSVTLTENGAYRVPSHFDSESLILFVDTLPAHDPPELFGLHDNADFRVKELESMHLLKCLVDLQATGGGGGASTSSGGDAAVSIVNEVLARIPVPIDLDVRSDIFVRDVNGVMTPLGNVAAQEARRYNTLVSYLQTQLTLCQLSLKGSVAMTEALSLMMRSLAFGQVPASWEAVAYPSMKPLFSWVNDLTARVECFRDWVDSGAPQSFWLGGFTFPQGFVAALLQTHSRQFSTPVDGLTISSTPTNETDPLEAALDPLPTGAYVHGLTLEGARWSMQDQCLEELVGKDMQASMPIVALIPTVKPTATTAAAPAAPRKTSTPTKAMFECPVYRIGTRAGSLSTTGISSNFILALQLDAGSVHAPEHWVERGCALLTSTSN